MEPFYPQPTPLRTLKPLSQPFLQFTVFIGEPDHNRQECCHDLVYECGKLIVVNHMFHRLVAGRLRQPTCEICVEALSMFTLYN